MDRAEAAAEGLKLDDASLQRFARHLVDEGNLSPRPPSGFTGPHDSVTKGRRHDPPALRSARPNLPSY
jgi:hypothetical protein